MKSMNKKDLEILYRMALEKRGIIRLKATGNSMYPTIKDGDIVTIRKFYSETPLGIGDIVLVKTFSGIVLHRIVDIREDMIVTMGDNNPLIDGVFSISDIIGIVDKPSNNSLEDTKNSQASYEFRKTPFNIFEFLIYNKENRIKEAKIGKILNDFGLSYKIIKNEDELLMALKNYKFTIGVTSYAPRPFESIVLELIESNRITLKNSDKIGIIIGAKYGYSNSKTDTEFIPLNSVSYFGRVSSPFVLLYPEEEILFCLGVLCGAGK